MSTREGAHVTSRTAAAAALLLVSPVLLLAALAIKLTSKGPVLYPAARVGRGGRPFVMLKLRTMNGGQARGQGPQRITGGQDSRVSLVGRWLRRLKIDELPQLANVVRGDMALVGPRPEDPSIVADFYTPFMLATFAVLPGLTSPGSLDYFTREEQLPADPGEAERLYVATLLPRKVALDLVYVHHRCRRYDLQLLVRTLACLIGFHTLFRRQQARESAHADELLVGATGGQGGRDARDG
jgi:lipopolysaccharide/colanic/teichoic acid biosynthesis glycosyltransferase